MTKISRSNAQTHTLFILYLWQTTNYQADGSKYDHLIENGSDFEIGDIIGKGWDLFQRDWLNILGFMFTIGLFSNLRNDNSDFGLVGIIHLYPCIIR